jgi:hypothetical protein
MERPRSRVRETGAFHVRNSPTASTATKQYDDLAPLCMTGRSLQGRLWDLKIEPPRLKRKHQRRHRGKRGPAKIAN